MSNSISLKIDNNKFEGWEEFTINRSLDSITGNFSVRLKNTNGVTDDILPQSLVEVFIGDDQLLLGYIYKRERSETKKATSLVISGRDVTANLVDCSAIVTTNYFNNKSVNQIIESICNPFDIVVDSSIVNEKVKTFSIQSGESASESIQRLCQIKGLIATTSRVGELTVQDLNPLTFPRSEEPLVRGVNIKKISESIDISERFSTIFLRGQDSGDGKAWTRKNLQQSEKATDENIYLYRPTVIVSESKSTLKDLKKRVAWEAQYRAGKSKAYTVITNGFRKKRTDDKNDKLWELGEVVILNHKGWGINEPRIISNIKYSFSDEGTLTEMVLSDPRTYVSNPSPNIKLENKDED